MSLNKRDAALRAEAVSGIVGAYVRLDGRFTGAFQSALRNHPKAALLAIRRAEARLARAKAALRKWAK